MALALPDATLRHTTQETCSCAQKAHKAAHKAYGLRPTQLYTICAVPVAYDTCIKIKQKRDPRITGARALRGHISKVL